MDHSKEKKKLSKSQLRTIIVAGISAVVAIALIITNFFVPVKYLFSYTVIRNKGAAEGVMRVRFVDVGYGDCIIVELPDGKNMLIDAGNGRSSNQSRILKYLNQSDIDTIDYLVCTSVNAEHCGGLAEIIQYKNVGVVYMPYCNNIYVTDEYRNFMLSISNSGSATVFCEYGAGVSNSEYGYKFKFLSPSIHTDPQGWYAKLNADTTSATARNNASAVLWLEYSGTSFLLTSDAGDEALADICASYGILRENYVANLPECTIIQTANHGNENSACAMLYDLVNPEAAIISVGENGHGSPSLNAISNAVNYVGEKLYRTDELGTITIEVTKDGYAVV